ncbi:MAG: rRNA pseudouridine synthase [Deltaproteobacteria bacterium]|nr:MAG: rRNA pseudouridine synthase [Deltaproteobacteria bacterium]
MPSRLIRLDRLLANRGLGSRSQVRALIRRGAVEIEGQVERDARRKVSEDLTVVVHGEPCLAPARLALLHKPLGVHSTVGDPQGRPNLAEAAAPLLRQGLHPVGRLDHDSEGLLPFSADGALTQRLLHPRHGVRKIYDATVQGQAPSDLGEQLARGIPAADGLCFAELIEVDDQRVRVAVTEGRHRMVRRMLANAGLPVVRLVRIAFGTLELGELAPGAHRVATEDELDWARSLIG